MKTGLTRRQKTTAVYFDEDSPTIAVCTHNTSLRKRLLKFAEKYPDSCHQTDDDEQGGLTFELSKGRLSFRLTAPYSEERKESASRYAKEIGIRSSCVK